MARKLAKQTSSESYSLHFNLKQTSDIDAYSQIMLVVNCSGNRIRFYTGMRVKPKNWCKSSQSCNLQSSANRREFKFLSEINKKLALFRHAIEVADNEEASKGKYLSQQIIRQTCLEIKYSTNSTDSPLQCLDKILGDYTAEVNRRGKKGIASTQTTYNTALKRLHQFLNTMKHKIQCLDDFDVNFFRSFTDYLYSYRFGKRNDKRYTQNTVINTLKVIKNLLHRAYDKDLTQNDNFKKFQTALPSDVTEPVYLTEKEIAKLAAMEVNTETEGVMRDAFVISCYTALRVSDVCRLNQAEFSQGTISMYQTKTKERVTIPILKEIAPLIDKYKVIGFPKMHNATLNNTIRELAKRCNINQSITYREIRGGEVALLTAPKYSLISFHTGRRSCITNLYKRGYPVNYIMSLSGHKSIQAFQRYMRASSKEIMNKFFSLLKKDKAVAWKNE